MNITNSKIGEIQQLVERMLPREDLFLVDLEIKGGQRSPSLWLYVESDNGGVSLDDCTELSRTLQTVLEAHDFFAGPFTLNISSPGLDKPLLLPRQYKVNEGRLVRIRLHENEHTGPGTEVRGLLTATDETGVEVTPRSQPKKKGQLPKLKPDKAQHIAFTDILEAKVLPDV